MLGERALVLLLAALACAGSAFAEETQAVLLFVGDTYGCLGYPGWPGGVARLAYAVGEQRKQHPDAPLLHTGNAIAPFYYSRFDQGRLYSQSLDSIGDVVWNLGFHDVDYGWQHLTELRADMTHTTLLGSNLTANRDAPRDFVVKQVGGLRIGFIGLVDPIVERLKAVGLFDGLAVREPFEAAREAVKRHRADADVLVLVADLPEDDAERLARETVGPDVVLSGSRHQQDWYTFFHGREPRQVLERTRADGSRVWMLSGPRDGFLLGKSTVSARRDTGKWRLERMLPEVIDLTPRMPQDERIWSRVTAHLNRLESQASTPLLTGLQQRFPDGLDGERFTGLVKHDRSAVVDTEYGLGFGYQGAKQLDWFRRETDTSFRHFFRRDDDAPDDLLYELYSKNEVVVPITSDVSVSLMGNLFAYHGKVVDSDGTNLFLGVGFRFDKLWKPRHEPFSK